jgi:glucosylceramidase
MNPGAPPPTTPGPNKTPEVRISVINRLKYQKIFGYGGAFTDATGINLLDLPEAAQKNLISSYYGPRGIGFTVGRVPIGGCDFSPRPYTYDDHPGDVNLTKFKLQEEDYKYKIPYIKLAQSISPQEVRLFGSPWTAPPWMKSNNDYKGLGVLRREYYQLWANYFVKFLTAYKAEGFKFWALTTQNEPFDGLVPMFPFNCMGWTAPQQRDFIKRNLGPTLRRSEFSDTKLIILDENTAALPQWPEQILSDKEAAQYVSGIGLHWYSTLMTGHDPINQTRHMFPNTFIFGTEACAGFLPWEREKVIIGSWERGEAYAEDIIKGIQMSVVGWTDWNLALNLEGGPNWAKLAADSAILINKTSGEFYKQPMFYALGHVAKFFLPNSDVIGVSTQYGSTEQQKALDILATGVQRPDGALALILLNKNEVDVNIVLADEDRGTSSLLLPKRSIQTLVYV